VPRVSRSKTTTLLAAAAAIAVPLAWGETAVAAVRSCKPGLTSEIARAETEQLGKRKALQSWTAKAAKAGPAYTNWRIADKKVLGCTKAAAPAQGFECIAYAAPCTIQQNPQSPRRKYKPAGANTPIET
jgi:hypothetical protein